MVTPRCKLSSLIGFPRVGGIVLALVMLTGPGCASQAFRADKLPPEYLAPVTANIEEINLSRLTNYSVDSQLIDRGDLLEVTIVTDLTKLTAPAAPIRVGNDGLAYFPPIGPVPVAGLILEEAEQAIAVAAVNGGVFRKLPRITVTMKEQRSNRINVIGAVPEEGTYELPRGISCVMNAIVAAGGLSEDAGQMIEIRHAAGRASPLHPPAQHLVDGTQAQLTSYESAPMPASPITLINLATAAVDGPGGTYLQDGDTVIVKKKSQKQVFVRGLVHTPGGLDLPANRDMYMLEALALSGGRTMQIANRVTILRRVGGQEIVIESNIRDAAKGGPANVLLAPGDIITVAETPATFVLDTLKSFIRFGLSSSIPMF